MFVLGLRSDGRGWRADLSFGYNVCTTFLLVIYILCLSQPPTKKMLSWDRFGASRSARSLMALPDTTPPKLIPTVPGHKYRQVVDGKDFDYRRLDSR